MRTDAKAWALLPLLMMAGLAQAQVDLSRYLKRDTYERIVISPDGAHYAATVPMEDRVGLVVIRRADRARVASAAGVPKSRVASFAWADDRRVVVSMAQALGSEDEQYLTGELHTLDIDGAKVRTVFGTEISPLQMDQYGDTGPIDMASLVDATPGDAESILVSTWPLGANPQMKLERIQLPRGRRTVVATAPVRRATYTVDGNGEARFAQGPDDGNHSRLYHRTPAGEWTLVNDERESKRVMSALGFSADGRTAYLRVDHPDGPDSIESWDPATGVRTPLLRDDAVDPYALVYAFDGRTPIGAMYMHGKDTVRTRFFDEASEAAAMHRRLERAFPGAAVQVTSTTRDGALAVVQVWSDRIPGEFYLYDTRTRRADGIFVAREWFDPKQVPPTRPVSITARDGLVLHGWLTLPAAHAGGALPTVLMPHGGPFGVMDTWGFDPEVVMLAEAGYAVLRVNFRGSNGRGRAFRTAGAQEWGTAMQDDLTDATRWAIEQGIADRARTCIVGASYGGYAALMGVAREPDLYRCAVGYVGVYDLVEMHRDNARYARWAGTWSDEWVGARDTLAARSPTQLADRIRAPVLLVAGGADLRAPLDHSKKMERALRKAGVPVETLYVDSEGHGFTADANRRTYYTRLLAFLSRHLGGATATP